MHAPRYNPLTAFFVGVLGIALFSGMDAVMKGLVLAIGTFATMFWRNLVGVALSGALYLGRGAQWPSRSTMKLHIGRGALSTVMGFLFFWGLARVPLAQAIALAFIAPLIALYLAAVMLHETIGRRTLAGSLIAFAGILVIFVGQAQADLGRDGNHRQHRPPRIGGLLCLQYHPDAPAVARRAPTEIAFSKACR